MKQNKTNGMSLLTSWLALLVAFTVGVLPSRSSASGGSGSGGGGGTSGVDTIKVSKCYYDAPTGQMLIKASSSDPRARLYAYRPDGSLIGKVQNGGGSRYGGTVMPYQPYDPGTVTIKSSSGGSITVKTGPFRL